MAAAAARRVTLEKPPTRTEKALFIRQRTALRKLVGANVRRARMEAGFTQVQLGIRADISANYLGQAELGRRGVTIDFLNAISCVLNIPVVWFLSPSE